MRNTRVKSLCTNNRDLGGINLISMQEWVNYYSELLTENRPQFDQSVKFTRDNRERSKKYCAFCRKNVKPLTR